MELFAGPTFLAACGANGHAVLVEELLQSFARGLEFVVFRAESRQLVADDLIHGCIAIQGVLARVLKDRRVDGQGDVLLWHRISVARVMCKFANYKGPACPGATRKAPYHQRLFVCFHASRCCLAHPNA